MATNDGQQEDGLKVFKPAAETTIIPAGVSKKLARRMEQLGIDVETAIQAARDYRTTPGHIAGWVRRHSLKQSEVEYLLSVRAEFDMPTVASFADLHRLWVLCSNEQSQFGEARNYDVDVDTQIGNHLFEDLLNFIDEAAGLHRYPLWVIVDKITTQYDGDVQRFHGDLVRGNARVILAYDQDPLERARPELRNMGFDPDSCDWDED